MTTFMKLKKVMHTLRRYTVHLPQETKDCLLVLLLFIIIVNSQSLLTENDEDF